MSELRRFNGYKPMPETFREQLPVGGYVARIQAVKVEDLPNGVQRLTFRTEIVEGPYNNFYHRDFDSQRGGTYEAKYRGDYSILCPDENGSDPKLVDWFNHTMGAIEDSNPGYTWDWRMNSLHGKLVGLSVREAEYQKIVFTEIGKFIPISIIREGRFRPMRRRISDETNASTVTPVASVTAPSFTPVDHAESASPAPAMPFSYTSDDDIPF